MTKAERTMGLHPSPTLPLIPTPSLLLSPPWSIYLQVYLCLSLSLFRSPAPPALSSRRWAAATTTSTVSSRLSSATCAPLADSCAVHATQSHCWPRPTNNPHRPTCLPSLPTLSDAEWAEHDCLDCTKHTGTVS